MGPGQYVNGVQTRKNFAESVFGGQSRSWIYRYHGFQKLPRKGLAYCTVQSMSFVARHEIEPRIY